MPFHHKRMKTPHSLRHECESTELEDLNWILNIVYWMFYLIEE